MILTWTCKFCGWNNDNNNGPCHKCGGHTEMRMTKGKWKEVTIKEPRKDLSGASVGGAAAPRERCVWYNHPDKPLGQNQGSS